MPSISASHLYSSEVFFCPDTFSTQFVFLHGLKMHGEKALLKELRQSNNLDVFKAVLHALTFTAQQRKDRIQYNVKVDNMCCWKEPIGQLY